MRHVFIVNPAAGKKSPALALRPKIDAWFAENGGEHAIYETTGPGDALCFAKADAGKSGEPVRYYACGGDGTLMEVVNGTFGAAHVEIASIPCGSANDYIRTFGGFAPFLSIERQVNGTAVPVDAINCNGKVSLNICAMGMDADVADKMIKFKNIPLVTGPMAYSLAVMYMFFHKIGRRLTAVIDTENGQRREISGDFLFSLAANGRYYGGNHLAAPQAVVNDGLLDFTMIETIGRLSIPGFLKKYKYGKHVDMDIVHICRGTKMCLSSDEPVTYVVDGECAKAHEVTFGILPKAVRFVLPDGVALDPVE